MNEKKKYAVFSSRITSNNIVVCSDLLEDDSTYLDCCMPGLWNRLVVLLEEEVVVVVDPDDSNNYRNCSTSRPILCIYLHKI